MNLGDLLTVWTLVLTCSLRGHPLSFETSSSVFLEESWQRLQLEILQLQNSCLPRTILLWHQLAQVSLGHWKQPSPSQVWSSSVPIATYSYHHCWSLATPFPITPSQQPYRFPSAPAFVQTPTIIRYSKVTNSIDPAEKPQSQTWH